MGNTSTKMRLRQRQLYAIAEKIAVLHNKLLSPKDKATTLHLLANDASETDNKYVRSNVEVEKRDLFYFSTPFTTRAPSHTASRTNPWTNLSSPTHYTNPMTFSVQSNLTWYRNPPYQQMTIQWLRDLYASVESRVSVFQLMGPLNVKGNFDRPWVIP